MYTCRIDKHLLRRVSKVGRYLLVSFQQTFNPKVTGVETERRAWIRFPLGFVKTILNEMRPWIRRRKRKTQLKWHSHTGLLVAGSSSSSNSSNVQRRGTRRRLESRRWRPYRIKRYALTSNRGVSFFHRLPSQSPRLESPYSVCYTSKLVALSVLVKIHRHARLYAACL